MRKLTKVTELCELEHLPRTFLPRSPPPALLEGSYCPFGQKALSGLSSFAFNTGMLFITSLATLSQSPLLAVWEFTALYYLSHCQDSFTSACPVVAP